MEARGVKIFFVYCLYCILSLNVCPQNASASLFTQINDDGFANHHTTGGLERQTMAVFQDKLYVGAANRNDGAVVMSYDEKNWVQTAKNGFGNPANTAITCLFATDKKLYAGTSNKSGGEVWEYDGANWRCLHQGPFGKILSNLVMGLAYYKGRVYVGLWDQIQTKPVEVWAGDEQGNWEPVSKPGLGDIENEAIPSMTISSVDGAEKLYVAVWKDFEYRGPDSGCEIWSFDGQQWEKRNRGREGFGELNKGRPGMEPLALFDFNNRLYVGLWSFGAGSKGELWSFDGKDWIQADTSLSTTMASIYTMASCKGKLYAVASNVYGKYELWENDGSTWTKLIGKNSPTPENFGNTDNFNISTMIGYNGRLYLGVNNNQTGFKVFQSSFPEITPAFQTAAVNTVDLLTLTEGVQPSKWSSSNPAVATIDPLTGYFKAVAPGTSVITAADDQGFTVASRQITVTQNIAQKKDAIFIFSRCIPPSAANDGIMPVKATAMPYIAGNAGPLAQVRIDFAQIGGATQDMYDDGTHGDTLKGDGIFSCDMTIPKNTKPGNYTFPVTGTTTTNLSGQGKAVLSVKIAYTAPELVYLKAKDSVYHIPVMFGLRDRDGDENAVTFEYQQEGGPWSPATVYSQSGMLTSSAAPGGKMNKLAKLKTNREQNHYVCVWESEKDIGQAAGRYRLRATPADAKSAGSALISDPVKVDNQSPPKNEMVFVTNGNFYIDKYEYPNHYGYYPMLRRTWAEACAECAKQGKELCTPEQWEAAYYGEKKLKFPYGNEGKVSGRDYCNTYGSMDNAAVPSGLYENCVNDLGIYDMGGNVYEWSSRSAKEVFMADQSYLLTSIDSALINVEGADHRHEFLGHRCCRTVEKK
jgi:hypothetical protein